MHNNLLKQPVSCAMAGHAVTSRRAAVAGLTDFLRLSVDLPVTASALLLPPASGL